MSYDPRGGGGPDYLPCRYGTSKLVFRGPKRSPDGNHVAVLGGTESYGKFIDSPWPDLLEQIVQRQVVNLAQINAGVDVHLNDRTVLEICQSARATVIELTGAHNLSNRYYAVHPRRNDRFLRASALLKSLYPDIDFTEFHFTRHLLGGLRAASVEKFVPVATALKTAWAARMRKLIAQVGGPVILLWMADHRPDRITDDPLARGGPLFIDAALIETLRPLVLAVVEIVGDAEERRIGYGEMRFGDMDAAAAAEMLGPLVHKRAALRINEALRGV